MQQQDNVEDKYQLLINKLVYRGLKRKGENGVSQFVGDLMIEAAVEIGNLTDKPVPVIVGEDPDGIEPPMANPWGGVRH